MHFPLPWDRCDIFQTFLTWFGGTFEIVYKKEQFKPTITKLAFTRALKFTEAEQTNG